MANPVSQLTPAVPYENWKEEFAQLEQKQEDQPDCPICQKPFSEEDEPFGHLVDGQKNQSIQHLSHQTCLVSWAILNSSYTKIDDTHFSTPCLLCSLPLSIPTIPRIDLLLNELDLINTQIDIGMKFMTKERKILNIYQKLQNAAVQLRTNQGDRGLEDQIYYRVAVLRSKLEPRLPEAKVLREKFAAGQKKLEKYP